MVPHDIYPIDSINQFENSSRLRESTTSLASGTPTAAHLERAPNVVMSAVPLSDAHVASYGVAHVFQDEVNHMPRVLLYAGGLCASRVPKKGCHVHDHTPDPHTPALAADSSCLRF